MKARRGDRSGALPRILPFDSRERIARVLGACSARERALLALLLCEKLTPNEAADALGMPAVEVERVYGGLMREMNGALEPVARRTRRARLADDPLEYRKAS